MQTILRTLHQVGALPITYGQFHSELLVQNFGELQRRQGGLSSVNEPVSLEEIESLFGVKQDILKFDNL